MKDCCAPINKFSVNGNTSTPRYKSYRKVLWVALFVNVGMFFIEVTTGIHGKSVSLTADALDFFGDALNYSISIFLLQSSLQARSKVSLFKGTTMLLYSVFVLALTAFHALYGDLPEYKTMGFTGLLALFANTLVAFLLFKYRNGDSNMQSVWVCTRNDVIGNIAVILASFGVFSTSSGLPDLIVGSIMGILGLQGAIQIIKFSLIEQKKLERENVP